MAKRDRSRLFVSMNGRRAGWLDRTSRTRLTFQYDPDWLSASASARLSVSLSLPLTEVPLKDDAVRWFFDNLLPDDPSIREAIRRDTGAESTAAFDLLAAVGGDCVGALQFHEGEAPPDVRDINGEPWSDRAIAGHLRDITSGGARSGTRANAFRISLAGAQRKSALLWHQDRWQRPLGPTPTTHILKLPIGQTPFGVDLSTSVDNEHVCALLTEAFGLQVASTEIVTFEDQRVLVVERFDRTLARDDSWWVRLPQEDICQATGTPGTKKYEADGGPGIHDILALLRVSEHAESDREAFFQAQVLFWLMAAIDGHAKNFSLFLTPGGGHRLTPLYDIMSAHPALASGDLRPQELRMAMAVTGKNRHYDWHRMRRRHFVATAKRSGIPAARAQELIDELVRRAPAAVEAVASDPQSGSADARIRDSVLEGVARAAERFAQQRDEV